MLCCMSWVLNGVVDVLYLLLKYERVLRGNMICLFVVFFCCLFKINFFRLGKDG